MMLFRPPFGDYNNELIRTTKACGYLPIQWDVDSLDWKDYGVESIIHGDTNARRIRVVFNGAKAASAPLITQMAIDCNIAANILGASTRIIGDKVYGNMLLGLDGGDDIVAQAKAYLERISDVIVEEVAE